MSDKRPAVAIIPARYGSSRFPGKPLAILAGSPMIQHVYQRVERATLISQVIVATDDERIIEAVERFGGRAVITSPHHPSGTDRVAEVAARLKADVVVNVQGDEPLISPRAVDQAIEPLLQDDALKMATLAHRFDEPDGVEMGDPDVVKVIVDGKGFAIDFFRLPDSSGAGKELGGRVLRHIGLYAYRRSYVLELAGLKPARRELDLGLEQLRALEHGGRIKVVETEYRCVGVDRPEDLKKAERLLAAQKEPS